jgi:nucleotide-binding universal stress UspA family protein
LAFQEAALRRVPLTAVLSWWITPLPVRNGYLSLANAEGKRGRGDHLTYGEEMRLLAEDRLERVLAPWRSKFPAVDVTSALRTDAPPRALHEAAGRAGLLVVGSRGLGPIRRLLLGSVGQAVLQHPPCSVAVVHSRY